ncbi:MAG: DMT family transporter [Gammaproteobacteria bacterium]
MTGTKPARALLPVFSLLLAASLWGVIWYPLRILQSHGLDGLWAALVSYSAAALPGLVMLWRGRGQLVRRPFGLLALAVAAGWCNVSFILAILDGTVVRVLLLFYLSPVWASLMGWIVLREPLSRRAVVVLTLAMGGVLFMSWHPELRHPWPREPGDWLAISSGFSFALANVLVRRLSDVGIPVKTAVTWVGVAGVAGVWLLAVGAAAPLAAGAGPWLGAAALGWFGIVLMTVSVQYGVTHMPVQRSAVILLFELVVGAVSSQLLTREVVTSREWLGGLLIMAAAYFAARVQGRHPE